MRGLTYKNVSGYSKLALMTDTPEDWKKFLTSVGTGHDFDSRDLRTVPTQDLMAVLHPMLTDPELMFYLEYSGNVASKIYAEAIKFNDRLPRQSASYVVSSTTSSGITVGSDIPGSMCTKKACAGGAQSVADKLQTLVDNAVSMWKWEINSTLYSYKVDTSHPEAGLELTDSYKRYTGTEKEIKEAAQAVLDMLGKTSVFTLSLLTDCEPLSDFKDSEGNKLDQILATIHDKYVNQLSTDSNLDTFFWSNSLPSTLQQTLMWHRGTPDFLYEGSNSYTDAVKKFPAFIGEYFEYLKNQIKNHRVSGSNAKVVVRFYPGNAIITEPLPAVQTMSLSENSFVQTVAPASNLSVVMQSNLAFDTPDTQWRELYANIFKIILSNGNPKCTARIGRHIIPNCYISAVSDFSNSHITTPVFAVSLISTEWDSAKLTPVNYVG